MSQQKLSAKREEEIRHHLKEANAKAMHYWTYDDENKAIAELLAEVTRLRPEWVPVSAGRHNYGDLYQVAGLPNEGQPPRWVGRGRYDAHEQKWYDEDTHRPFRFKITHWFHTLSPSELIGQPTEPNAA